MASFNAPSLTPQPPQTLDGAGNPDTSTTTNGTTSRPSSTVADERNDAITEGKERARAVVAASTTAQQSSPRRSPMANSNSAENGEPSQGTKRSRSGSRRPPAQPKGFDYSSLRQLSEQRAIAHNAEAKATVRQYQQLRQVAHQQPESRLQPRIKYPNEYRRAGNRRTPMLRLTRKDRNEQAEQLEELVPVRLDLEFDKLRLRDTFTWNVHDRTIDPKYFASMLVEDFQVPPEGIQTIFHQVQENLEEQIQDFHPHIYLEEEALDPHSEYFAYKNDEMRILIRLNITIGAWTLTDQFDWDINNPLNSPEEFARQMSLELSLGGEFTTAISHSIREQIQLFTKGLYVTGHPFDGRPVEDSDIRDCLLPSPLSNVFRPFQAAKEFAPQMYPLADQDLERQELVFSREHRQQKRSVNRRGGPSLPDFKERAKTWRTQIVSNVIPDAAPTAEASGLYRITRRSGKGRKPWKADGGDDSDESDEEESEIDSPARNPMQGTARTRGIRGAATAAQAAMKANLARSQSPDFSAALHHHETRSLPRKFGLQQDDREESEPQSLIVKLKISRDKFRAFLQALRSGQLRPPPQYSASPRAGLLGQGSPAMGMPNTPATPGLGGANQHGPPPALPPWLDSALRTLKTEHPRDSFDGIMKWVPARGTFEPRIRCNDCPGMLYNTNPSGPTENFRKHLRHGDHVEKRDRRIKEGR